MAIENILGTIPGLAAAADYSSSGGQYYVVKYASTVGQVKVVSATTDEAIGIMQDTPKQGQATLVANLGISKVVAGTSVGWTAGGRVGFNSTGKAVPHTTSGRRIIGTYQMMESAVALNQIVSISLLPGALLN